MASSSSSLRTHEQLDQQRTTNNNSDNTATIIGGYKFEVYGKVQGVFFRKYTQQKANELQLQGWIRNTYRTTVEGVVVSANVQKRNEMKVWLQTIGSPKSSIDHAEFRTLDINNNEDDQLIIDSVLQQSIPFDVKKTSKNKSSDRKRK